RFNDIPWPVFHIVSSADDITYASVHQFIYHPLWQHKACINHHDVIRRELFRWHPDKFRARMMPKIHSEEQEAILRAAMVVSQHIIEVMRLSRLQGEA
ncbi:hypothetical protein OBBRIDRAFT_740153, partial [Obba rivulosa]